MKRDKKPTQSAEELRQLFKNKSDCYADTWKYSSTAEQYVKGEVIQAMTEDRFTEVMTNSTTQPTQSANKVLKKHLDKAEIWGCTIDEDNSLNLNQPIYDAMEEYANQQNEPPKSAEDFLESNGYDKDEEIHKIKSGGVTTKLKYILESYTNQQEELITELKRQNKVYVEMILSLEQKVSDEEIEKMALKRANYNPFSGKTGKEVHFQGWISGAKCLRDKLTTKPTKGAEDFIRLYYNESYAKLSDSKYDLDEMTEFAEAYANQQKELRCKDDIVIKKIIFPK